MKKYAVEMDVTISVTVTVEAESEEHARQVAMHKTATEPSYWISRWDFILERNITDVNESE